MYQIQTLNKISPLGLEKFDRSKYCWGDEVKDPDAILVRSASMHEMELPGVVVFNTPGANANAVKELVLLGLLLSARKIQPAMDWIRTLKGQGAEVPKLVEKAKGSSSGRSFWERSWALWGWAPLAYWSPMQQQPWE